MRGKNQGLLAAHDDAWECFWLPAAHRRGKQWCSPEKMSYTVAVMPKTVRVVKEKKNQRICSDIMKKDLSLCILEKVNITRTR